MYENISSRHAGTEGHALALIPGDSAQRMQAPTCKDDCSQRERRESGRYQFSGLPAGHHRAFAIMPTNRKRPIADINRAITNDGRQIAKLFFLRRS